jgi:hypothetical protein
MYLLFLLIGILLFLILNKKNKFCISVQDGINSESGNDDNKPNIDASVGESGNADVYAMMTGLQARNIALTEGSCAAIAGATIVGLGLFAHNRMRGNNQYVDVENQSGDDQHPAGQGRDP